MEAFREEVENQMARSGRGETLVVGGDFNAQIGRDSRNSEAYGAFGLRTQTNEAGRSLLEWCVTQRLIYANSFSWQRKRGTWFHRPLRRWYELDGFLLKREQRHEIMIKAGTVGDMAISDHNSKILTIRRASRKKRRVTHEQRKALIQWNKLQDEEMRDRYKETTTRRLNNIEEGLEEMGDSRNVVAEVVIEAAEEICGKKGRTIANPWTVGREEQLRELHERIRRGVQRIIIIIIFLAETEHMCRIFT